MPHEHGTRIWDDMLTFDRDVRGRLMTTVAECRVAIERNQSTYDAMQERSRASAPAATAP